MALDATRNQTSPRLADQRGFSLVEMGMGLIVFATLTIALGNHITTNYAATNLQQDRVFAYTKAQAILSEIHAKVDDGTIDAAIDLDTLDDGVTPAAPLTTTTVSGSLVPASHPVSGNFLREGDWVWWRQITVRPFAGINNRNVRYVTVRIFKSDVSGRRVELASLSSVVNSVGSAFPTTQVFDVYLLAVENIPGWWVYMEAIIPFVESAITDLEGRNPGLSLRAHWITKAGFGRNPMYRPFTNEVYDSYVPSPFTYIYPGRMPAGNASTYYYVPSLMNGRAAVDGVDTNGYNVDTNPYPYTLPDYYNHAMRYPQAKAFHDERVAAIRQREADIAAANVAGVAPPPEFSDMSVEPPLQVLLEGMVTSPNEYRNALLVNLHGELLPVPALNNVSSPAKEPASLPQLRVVTHPEQLRAVRPPDAGAEDVAFRVYAYLSDPLSGSEPGWVAANGNRTPEDRPIELRVLNMDLALTDGRLIPHVSLQMLEGGVDLPRFSGTDTEYKKFDDAIFADWTASDPDIPDGYMRYWADFVTTPSGEPNYTRILLFNTPVKCPIAPDGGLDDEGGVLPMRARPYGLEYNPAPTQGTNFEVDLWHGPTPVGDTLGPRNTARWRLVLDHSLFSMGGVFCTDDPVTTYYVPATESEPDELIAVQTRIYDPSPDAGLPGQALAPAVPDDLGSYPRGSEARWVQPENFSETYCWWTDSVEDVPFTERSQFLGDPRHMPYMDFLDGDPDFANRYNWYHDDLDSSEAGWGGSTARSDYPGLTRVRDRWSSRIRADVPRFMELYRYGLVSSSALYTTLTGYSYFYIGIGNEIGYDAANGYPSSIPTNVWPWGVMANGNVNNITTARCLVTNTFGWIGLPWLGELYPDEVYPIYSYVDEFNGEVSPIGNVIAGTGAADRFFRLPERNAYVASRFTSESTDYWTSTQRLAGAGCVTFFNNGPSSSHFNHHFSGGAGTLTSVGQEIADNYGFPVPVSTEITRPFSLDTGGNTFGGYDDPEYSSNRFPATLRETYYSHGSGHTGSGLVELEMPDASSAALIIVNGLAQTTTTGTSVIAKFCLLSMMQSFFEMGETGLTHRIAQPPRVEILSPTEITEVVNPTSVTVQWRTAWVRWDGQPYTNLTASTFTESEADIEYVLMYSRDNGSTWQYVRDDTPAEPGVLPDVVYRVLDTGTGDESFVWATPSATFPDGTYILRIEAYRTGQALHYSQHMSRMYVQR